MVVGSLASSFYGVPRSTLDADFVVEMQPDRIRELLDQLEPNFLLDPQLTFETITAAQRFQFAVKGSQFKVELFFLKDEPYARTRFSRRRRVTLKGVQTWMSTAEDVVVEKLRWHRDKDLIDAAMVIHVQNDARDWIYVETWCAELGVLDLLDQTRRSLG